ncbi:nitrite reductase small subunit NirD [Halomonas sp. TRM85114]|uniref:nitrite reductase small subunit NirD n=1 Tax=Halomonas jincaotanensis TaxID=2810616 RepID=UPI001BD2102E|nr:nitrite reductase small subunit NirD [Halomonas jincaotanensis]MBS9402971.1 nitrite reductase small subunit NirD [Halomonas jincaotanensis]
MTSATAAATSTAPDWLVVCTRADLVPYSGVAAWVETAEGPAQVAIFYIPCGPNTPRPAGPNTPALSHHDPELYAIDHHDPIAGANVIARGIVGDLKGQPVVASPIYKQHFRLEDGQCLEDEAVKLRTWPLRFDGEKVLIKA